jgi:hypothetical protein
MNSVVMPHEVDILTGAKFASVRNLLAVSHFWTKAVAFGNFRFNMIKVKVSYM